nr:hypothetical protein [Halarchaeum acidiphilum]
MGAVLLLSLTLLVSGVTVAMGNDALTSTQEQASLTNAEHVMTFFDSQASLVALGRSSSQTVDLGSSGHGEYVVHPDRGWIKLVRETDDGTEPVLNNTTLGSVTYAEGGTEIAYQGGGVWRADQSNGSILVSPPEFHYDGQTLTLPVMTVSAAPGERTGTRSATVTPRSVDEQVFPNASRGANFTNPLEGENLTLVVHSRYARGWERYFRTRTPSNVTRSGSTIRVNLTTPGPQGYHGFNDKPWSVRGLSRERGYQDLNVSLKAGSSGHIPDDFGLEITANAGQSLTISPENWKKQDLCSGDDTATVDITYSNESATQQWTGGYPVSCDDGKVSRLHLNLTSTRAVTYTGEDAITLGNETFGPEEQSNSSFVVNRYATRILADGSETINVEGNFHGHGHSISDQSFAEINYEAGERATTYLHVTKNNVTVALR